MSLELAPALIAAGGGSALLVGIWTHEWRRDAVMRASRSCYQLRFPLATDAARAQAALDGLSGLPLASELVAEVRAGVDGITHALWIPAAVKMSALAALTGAVPGLRIREVPASDEPVSFAVQMFVLARTLLTTEDPAAAGRVLLTGLAALRGDERVTIRYALRPGPAYAPDEEQTEGRDARERERLWRSKTALRGFDVNGMVLVEAGTHERAKALAEHVIGCARARRGALGGVKVRSARRVRSTVVQPRTGRKDGWLSSPELLGLLAWPIGGDVATGVEVGASRELLVGRHIPRQGRHLFVGRDSFGERPVALDSVAARHHMAVVGPSGVGKSVLLARAILSDIEQGSGGVVIDPKADLLETIIRRVKPEHAERIVVMDPGDARPVPGLAVLSGGDPDLRTDVLTGTLKGIFGDAWGVRSDFYGRLAIRTLSEVPGATLADLGRLFYEDEFRRRAVERLRDPFLLSSWRAYEALSPAARAEHVQAPMARVMGLLARPRVRSVLASPDARLDVSRLLAERKWLLASLAPGQLSEAGAAIVGSSLVYAVWSAIEARAAIPPERRHPIYLYVDELSTLTGSLPFSFELLAERARGLGAGLTVAIQTLGRIPEPTRSALLGNVATFISFRAPAEDASRLARQFQGLSDADLTALGRFEVAARIGTGAGSAVAVMTGRTEPLPRETGMADAIRDASARRYGPRPPATPGPQESALRPADTDPLGAERRRA